MNDTGQTLCYDGNDLIGCTADITGDDADYPRQDGRYGRDAQMAAEQLTKIGGGLDGFDFTKIANSGATLSASATLGTNPGDWACTQDNVTGLIWEIKTDSGLRDKDWTYTWYSSDNNGGDPGNLGGATCGGTLPSSQCNTQAFVHAVNAAGLCGYQDWRLPTVTELLNLVHVGIPDPDPLIDGEYFPNTIDGEFWTSSLHGNYSYSAWDVSFDSGVSSGTGSRDNDIAVRLVRGGQQPVSSFTNHGDGTVTDNNTGLMWSRCSEGQTGSTCANGSTASMSWSDALTAAKMSRLAEYSDWRLPNKKELESLADRGRSTSPAIDTTYFPATEDGVYWTTTFTPYYGQYYLKMVDFSDGTTPDYHYSSGAVRLVRGGGIFDALGPRTLALSKTGNGTVASAPAGINCGSDCSEEYANGSTVTLTAAPNAGAKFLRWGGDCAEMLTCVVEMTKAHTVVASFDGSSVMDRGRVDWQVTEIYTATMGYAPDQEGLQYWVKQIQTNPQWNPTTVAQSFFDQPLVQAKYPTSQGYGPLIDALYQNIFGRAADAAGYAYWLGELESGHVQRNQMVIALIEGGWGNPEAAADMARFANQVEVGLTFTAEQLAHGIVYGALSEADRAALRQIGTDLLADVTNETATRDQAIARIPALLDAL